MKTGKRSPSHLDLPMGAFQVQPDWYEAYWLKPDEAFPTAAKPRRWHAALYTSLGAVVFSLVAIFVRFDR
jgi:hypothetical protein